MAINLITGQPRNGKTLWTIWHLRAFAQREGRTVYYNLGNNDRGKPKLILIPGWVHLEDPESWFTLPDHSIVLIDEAQRIFRPRASTRDVPEYVSKLETHGHNGFDIFVITQHPGLIEANVLRLVQTHRHIKRLWGATAATVHEWETVNKNPDQSRAGSIATTWRYPKDVYSVYDSASVHTVKFRPPLRLFLLVVMLIGGPSLLGYALFRDRGVKPQQVAAGIAANGTSGQVADGGAKGHVLTASEYVDLHLPRVAGLQHTAPAYDAVTQPVTAPFPAACVATASRCRCNTQQATRMDMAESLCRTLAERGFFRSWMDKEPVKGGRVDSPAKVQPEGATQAAGPSVAVGFPGPPGKRPGPPAL